MRRAMLLRVWKNRKSGKLAGKFVVALFLTAPAASAQRISLGVVGGVPFTDGISDSTMSVGNATIHSFSPSKLYIVGAMAEVRLPLGLAIEVDGLYRPISIESDEQLGSTTFKSPSANFSNWEFPVLGKYRFPFPVVKPFVEAGLSFRKTGCCEVSYLSNHGVTFGGGVELKLLKLRVAPAIRYTRWRSDTPLCPSNNGIPVCSPSFPPSNRNQAELLVGVYF
jgi:hypothetical protein